MKLTERQVLEQFDTVTRKELRRWVHSGWIVPAQSESGPSFDDVDVARIRLVYELRRDMNVNDDAVPIILALLDQLYGLRRELRTIATALLEQPDEVRQQLKQALLSHIGQQH
ncbi:hypothetical protein SM0020_00385 [Sinorhizobium meliloti CCNWSX0020]|uniref:Chaperone modulatory protein CbpM n=1 Tax=Sinorhizobium meliloti CCNWSX0020 TaxID=1107881 RepID=H0FSG6_RHIML|nr:chaperone modulator CbpM [Sinorhizobium meliloti]EHK79916.1 hypothetical protein SM0020_00385 [Sinorhizobium meliloti CCNWSX0020]RVE89902.1 hypothetical protein CN238_12720 [Sinorhizobium meliloti]RVG62083.1 hypothetical protein CN220_29745 [Sinorhizobium meliloti]RVH34025.1 hypothetical protein CN214_06680 [Sinorhizobium meliloti]RVH38051.1 hypothetical protein CN211_05440 [Sinorhizobium meliloti]